MIRLKGIMSLVVHVTEVAILGQVKDKYGSGPLMFVNAYGRDTYHFLRIFYKLKNMYLVLKDMARERI